MKRLRSILRAVTLERLLPLAIIGGALILIGSEFADTLHLEAAGDDVLDRFPGYERHSWAVLILGVFAIAGTVAAIVTGSRAAAAAVAVFGSASLLLFLLIDVPDAGRTDNYSYPGRAALEVAEAVPAPGFWLLLIGSLVVAVCGIALATLTSDQLRALRPGAPPPRRTSGSGGKTDTDGDEKGARRSKRDRPPPPWSRRRSAAKASDNGGDEESQPQERPKRTRRERRSVRPKT